MAPPFSMFCVGLCPVMTPKRCWSGTSGRATSGRSSTSFPPIPRGSIWLKYYSICCRGKYFAGACSHPNKALVTAIRDCIGKLNEEGRTFGWTKTAEAIITSVNNLT